MANINFRIDSKSYQSGVGALVSTVSTSPIPGWNKDRIIAVTPAMVGSMGVPPGVYEHIGESANGDWTYRRVE